MPMLLTKNVKIAVVFKSTIVDSPSLTTSSLVLSPIKSSSSPPEETVISRLKVYNIIIIINYAFNYV